jgi:exopolysaccharide production protein ExoY
VASYGDSHDCVRIRVIQRAYIWISSSPELAAFFKTNRWNCAGNDAGPWTFQSTVGRRKHAPKIFANMSRTGIEVSYMQQERSLRAVESTYANEKEHGVIGSTSSKAFALTVATHADPRLWSAISRSSSFQYAFLKRGLDIVLSSFLLIALFPLGLLTALLVLCTSRGPIFFRQERIGRFGVPFQMIKFRSMYNQTTEAEILEITEAHCNAEVYFTNKKSVDPRITPLGRVLRKLSIDELPQLFNVLRGQMSLVGPRPIVEAERAIYGKSMPYYDLLTPGITGLWQVSGRSDLGYSRRIWLDTTYATQWSCLLDFVILARTIPAVISMRGAY